MGLLWAIKEKGVLLNKEAENPNFQDPTAQFWIDVDLEGCLILDAACENISLWLTLLPVAI